MRSRCRALSNSAHGFLSASASALFAGKERSAGVSCASSLFGFASGLQAATRMPSCTANCSDERNVSNS